MNLRKVCKNVPEHAVEKLLDQRGRERYASNSILSFM